MHTRCVPLSCKINRHPQPVTQPGTIFKTFDSSIDKWTAKIGVFGKSFHAIGTAVNDALEAVINNLDNFDEDVGFWESLKANLSSIDTGKNLIKNPLGEVISQENIDSYIEELDLNSAEKILKKTFNWQKDVNNNKKTWQEYFDTFDNGDDYIVKLIKNTEDLSKLESQDLVDACQEARESVLNHNQALENMSLKSKAGKVALQALSAAANTALMFLASMAVQALTDAWNSWNKTVKSSQEQVANISSRLENLNQELSELKNIENKSEYDHLRIQQLETEIGLQERLLEIEQKRLYQNQVGTTFSDYFDADSLVSKKTSEENRYNKTGYEYLSNQYEKNETDLNGVDEKIAALNNSLLVTETEAEKTDILEALNEATQSRSKLLEEQVKVEEQLTLNSAEYLNNYHVARDAVNSGLLSGSDLEKAKEMSEYWNQMYLDSLNMVSHIQKQTGTFDNSKLIKDTLAKTDFQEISRQLEELGSTGQLSVAVLSSQFPSLIKYLDNAGVSAQELYEYIMALYGPDTTNYDNTRNQLMNSLGFGDTIDSAGEAQLWNSLSKLGSEELILDAYLQVKDLYGEHPEGWTPEDWFTHIQSELENRQLELHAQLSVTETLGRLDERLNPALDSLKSAYQSIFTDDGFTLENVGVDMLRSISSSIDSLNAMEDVDIQIDPSAFEDFAQTLTDTASTADDVQEQFRALTNTIVRAAGSTAVDADNFNVLARSLEEMGAVNARDVLEEIMLAQQDFEAISDELGLTLEDVAGATYQETVQMLQNAQAAGLNTQALWKLAVAQGTITDGTIATESNVDALLAEAQAAGLDASMLTALGNIQNGNIKDTAAAQKIMEQARQDIQASMADMTLDFDLSSRLGNKGTSAAKSAGRDAGDAYVDAFEKELEDLKTLRDRGTITEKAYLDEFRRLYQRYYRDKKKYAEEYAKYEHEYLQGMKSLYESALSGITSMLDKQIGTYEDQKSAAVDSLEAERDARIEVLETQKEQYEEQIKLIDEQIEAKEKIIDGINEEIDAIKDANEQRKREIDLEKSKYELERMMNQRTILQYSADKGMHYTQDTEGARDAKQAVEDAELEIEIAGKEEQIKLIEKEIDLLEERKESINEQIDQLDVQIDQINKQYDQMIAETEQYWDSIIQGMEDYKSRWQELGEIEEQAKLTAALEQLGISTNDILNMSGEAFARFKEEYLGLLADIYSGNDTMLSGLSDAAGINTEALGSYLEATQQYIDGLNGLGEAISPVSDAIGAVTGALTGGSSSGGQGTDGTDTGTDTGTGGLVGAMNSLKEATDEALGSGGDESASDGTGAIGKFGQLKGAVTDVTAAIGSDTSETSGESVSGEQTDGTSENGKGLIGSVGNLGQKTEEILGEPDGEGVTGRFGQLSEVIGQAKDYVHEMLEGLRDIDGETFECTIKINVDMNGELPGAISGTISSKIQAGVRNFSNSKPVRDDTPHISSGLSSQSAETTAAEPVTADIMTAAETSTVGIIPVAGTSTVGVMPTAESEPEISAFSPESFRNGAEPLPTQKDGSLLRPIGPGERAYELHKAFEPLLEKADDSFEYLSGNAMITHTRLIEKMVRDITAANMITNNKNIQPNIRIGDIRITCPGVTSREVAAQVGSELNRLFSGFHLYTEQQSAIR